MPAKQKRSKSTTPQKKSFAPITRPSTMPKHTFDWHCPACARSLEEKNSATTSPSISLPIQSTPEIKLQGRQQQQFVATPQGIQRSERVHRRLLFADEELDDEDVPATQLILGGRVVEDFDYRIHP